MSIKRTIITTIVALAVVAVVAPGVAQGVTIDELLAQIAQLQAQLVALQGGSTPTTGGTGLCAGVTFTRNMTVGATGSDVRCLQSLLNQSATTRVALSGAGSPGNETSYFGQLTLVAVKKFQAAQGFTPANQVGPLTRAKLNAMLGGTTSPVCGNGICQTGESAATCPADCTGTVPPQPTGAGLSVYLASDNPAAGTIVDGQALAPLAKFTFVNGDNAEVKVTSLKLKRIGIAADSSLTNVYLFDGAKRLTDSASVASTIVNFNDSTGVFTVPAGGSKTISVLADVDGSVGELFGAQITASTDITSNASAVNGSFPVKGNLFTLADGTNLATIYMADETGTTTPATASIDPQNDYAIWYDNLIVGTRAVYLNRIAFRVGGSVNRQSDVRNFRLLIDGVQAGSAIASADSSDYVTFDLSSSPVKVETGTRVIKVLADIIGGSNKNVYLSLRTASDLSAVDSQMNATLLLHRYTTTTSFTAEDSGTQTINSGTLTITKMTTSPSGDLVDAANNVVLAKYELKAAGERVKIESLRVSATVSDTGVGQLRNGALYANGVQVGSTTDIKEDSQTTAYTTFNFGSSLIVDPGSPVTLEVRSDVYDSGTLNNAGAADTDNDISANDTIKINIVGGDLNNAYGMVSLATVDVPSATVSGNTLTVKAGGLTLSKYTAYTNQNAVVPLQDYKLAHFTLTANTVEAVNINSIYVYFNYVSANVDNFYVKFGNNTTAVKSSPTSGTSRSADSWSVNYSLAAGATVDVMVYGNVDSSAGGVSTTGVYMTGTTASSATAVTAGTINDATTGQTITFTTGSMTTALDGATPLNQAVAGNQSVIAGKFKFTASNDSFTIKETKFQILGTDATSAVVNSLTLKDGDTALATVPYDVDNDWFYITGLTVPVAANSTKVLTAVLNLATPYTDTSTVTTGVDAKITLYIVKYANSQGTETTSTVSKVANYTYVYKSIPTFTALPITGQGTLLTAGNTIDLYKFSVKADAKGPVSLKQLKFSVDITDGGTASAPTLDTFKFFRGSTNLTTSVTIQDSGRVDLETTTTSIDESDSTAVYVTFDTEEVIPAGTTYTYTLQARPQGFMGLTTDADSVSTYIAQDTTPAGVAAGADATLYYLASVSQSETNIQFLKATVNGTSGTDVNVIWSDNSAQLHGYVVDTVANGASADWFNGYLLDTFPTTSVGINYNN